MCLLYFTDISIKFLIFIILNLYASFGSLTFMTGLKEGQQYVDNNSRGHLQSGSFYVFFSYFHMGTFPFAFFVVHVF